MCVIQSKFTKQTPKFFSKRGGGGTRPARRSWIRLWSPSTEVILCDYFVKISNKSSLKS